jgi:hypothetical protein
MDRQGVAPRVGIEKFCWPDYFREVVPVQISLQIRLHIRDCEMQGSGRAEE